MGIIVMRKNSTGTAVSCSTNDDRYGPVARRSFLLFASDQKILKGLNLKNLRDKYTTHVLG